MTPETKKLVLQGLSTLRGDNLERAEMAFRGLSAEVMGEEYGQSGQTRREILDGYRKHAEAVEKAIAEVTAL